MAFGASPFSLAVDAAGRSLSRSLPWLRGAEGELGLSVAHASSDGTSSLCFSLDSDVGDCCSCLSNDDDEGAGGGENICDWEDDEPLFLPSTGFAFPGVPRGLGGAPSGFETAGSGGGGGGAWRETVLERPLRRCDDSCADDERAADEDDDDEEDDDVAASSGDERRAAVVNAREPLLPTSASAVEGAADAATPRARLANGPIISMHSLLSTPGKSQEVMTCLQRSASLSRLMSLLSAGVRCDDAVSSWKSNTLIGAH